MPPAAHFFINSLQKRAKKTNFYAVPTLVSQLGGILGCGCHPLFVKKWFVLYYKKFLEVQKPFGSGLSGLCTLGTFYYNGGIVMIIQLVYLL